MLKIKENVDLKELEKFGFELNGNEWYLKQLEDIDIFIKPISKVIIIACYEEPDSSVALHVKEIDTIYDLIQAGLVEKVSG